MLNNIVRLLKEIAYMCFKVIVVLILGIVEIILAILYGRPKFLSCSYFSICPVVSFYPKALEAIRKLQLQPFSYSYIENFGAERYYNVLKLDSHLFKDLARIVKDTYNIQETLDEIRLEKTAEFISGLDEVVGGYTYTGGEYYLKLLYNGQEVKVSRIDRDFLEVRQRLDDIAQKRLAIAFGIVGVIGVVTGVLLWK